MVIFAPFLLKVYSNVKVNEELKLFHLKLIDSIKWTTTSLTCQSWIQNSFWQDRTLKKKPLKWLGSFLFIFCIWVQFYVTVSRKAEILLTDSIKRTTIYLTCQSKILKPFWQDRTLKKPLKQLGSFLHFWHLSPILWNSFKKSCNFIDGFDKMDYYISNLSILVVGFYLGRQHFEKPIKTIWFISTFFAPESNFMEQFEEKL